MRGAYLIELPKFTSPKLSQDQEYFDVYESDVKTRIRMQDYDNLYVRSGLYEQILDDVLKCISPVKIVNLLTDTLSGFGYAFSELRIIELGAGNGSTGKLLREKNIESLVGSDISQIACNASQRDAPNVYDEYLVYDSNSLTDDLRHQIQWSRSNCLVASSCLAFDDVSASGFASALACMPLNSLVAFNIRDEFVNKNGDVSLTSSFNNLLFGGCLQLLKLELYTHRLSVQGVPLYYYAVVCRTI